MFPLFLLVSHIHVQAQLKDALDRIAELEARPNEISSSEFSPSSEQASQME
jgi:hypothetical protein